MIPNIRNYDAKQQTDIDRLSVCCFFLLLQSMMNSIKTQDSTQSRLSVIKAYFESHYNQDPCLAELSSMVGMTAESLSRFMSMRLGMRFSDCLKEQRLRVAERELRETVLPVSEICYRCGYSTLSNFNRQFKVRNGCTPTEYRKRCKNGKYSSQQQPKL